jgi:hypothetical protein
MPETRNDLRVGAVSAAARDASLSPSVNSFSYITVAGTVTAPTVPATTVALPNPFGCRAVVYITGGTVTVINVGAQVTGLTSGTFILEGGDSITLTHSAPPTWKWSLIP